MLLLCCCDVATVNYCHGQRNSHFFIIPSRRIDLFTSLFHHKHNHEHERVVKIKHFKVVGKIKEKKFSARWLSFSRAKRSHFINNTRYPHNELKGFNHARSCIRREKESYVHVAVRMCRQ